ncbi:spore germination protein GerPB [Paenibacillus thiaminolyticus]|uniref:Spore germination protein GerPB n=1 Tax=Paenibacillus thiaminolyticus TaxID=49283 RepID=A0AAP9DU24_PANTH|nr:spore germination protein GerPB [Paenibacillus thiaminolyticus]MCY9538029.1 spore germination protein GerPB [Paenibacillus thiaminolyticus]MCY9604905.1 spore germination protein GerPB [Paenibacillus thiaminolyticus]MCY9610640.1 spore germination protein GerPB [Paenibacillus thiaminolyticus]MCY9615968.1 spore germination protein GerPB [Paenibacillus thiaminolyticus]MCY9622374.1 spore germination protein GerPB [Paenibacillus thiaminolyticus]
MNLIVHQSITIQNLCVNTISNSSVLQIGSAGVIQPLSNPPSAPEPVQSVQEAAETGTSLVPLPPPA